MNNEFHEKLTAISTAWANAERDASLAEAEADRIFARLFAKEKMVRGVEEARQAVKASDEYFQAQKGAITERHNANLCRRAIKDAETSFERWRTMQANERFTSRVST